MNAEHWSALAAFAIAVAVLGVLCWALRGDDYRSRNDRIAARRISRLEDRPEPAEPGSNERDLQTCNDILAATNDANVRKEDRP